MRAPLTRLVVVVRSFHDAVLGLRVLLVLLEFLDLLVFKDLLVFLALEAIVVSPVVPVLS